jgi:alpha-N-acetylglucosaminidase
MKRCTLLAAPVLVLLAAVDVRGASPEEAASKLVERLLPGRAQEFVFEMIPAQDGRDVFELESREGKVVVRGNSALSMAFGLNWYMKYYGHCNVSINGRQLNLPSPLPPVEKRFRLASWAKSRYLLNYCTFGYVKPWWDWPQWEKFIDWMALNGVNTPLAVTGQEGVWQAVGRKLGMTDAEIEAFLPGPPYLPFGWMGCLDGHGGPLPKDWTARHVELGQKIVARERELGMTPVLQGFTGHIPPALAKKFPGTKTQRIHWIEFDTYMLDPQDPLFQKIATAFIEEQTRLFGTDHLYDADSFIEMSPPSGDLKYLADIGRAIYEGMAEADPKAVWLLQGWTFMHKADFWKQDRIKAFLDAVPSDRMLVLDLFCERTPVWNTTQGFYGKPWVWSFVYNFGDTTVLGGSGPLTRLGDLAAVRKHALGQKVRGVGLLMEGYGHSPLVFDLMYEMAWRDEVDLAAWMREYPRFRYGRTGADAESAWQTLRTGIYGRGVGGQTILTAFPAVKRQCTRYPAPALAKTWQLLLRSDKDLGGTETYRHDLVNVARQALSNHAGQLYARTMVAYDAKDLAAYRKSSQEFLELIRDIDELLASNDEFLLGAWLEDARRWGRTDAERARLEWNARRVLTLWGKTPALRDYAWKEWSGMLSGFYAKRWELFFQRQMEALEANRPFDQKACHAELLELEEQWAGQTQRYPSKPVGDSLQIAGRLFEKYMRGDPPFKSLTTGKPTSCSAALPGMDADLANDGCVDTESYWGTDVSKDKDAWWQVDLEQETTVGRVVVVGYHDDKRFYGFTVEVSRDGKAWTTAADRRDNKELSTPAGHTCVFEPRKVRFIRVKMTGNSANTGRHLVEVMAYEK